MLVKTGGFWESPGTEDSHTLDTEAEGPCERLLQTTRQKQAPDLHPHDLEEPGLNCFSGEEAGCPAIQEITGNAPLANEHQAIVLQRRT